MTCPVHGLPWYDTEAVLQVLRKYHRLVSVAHNREELDVHLLVLAPGEVLTATIGPVPNVGTEGGCIAYACVTVRPEDVREDNSKYRVTPGGFPMPHFDDTRLRQKAEDAIGILADAFIDTVSQLGEKYNLDPNFRTADPDPDGD